MLHRRHSVQFNQAKRYLLTSKRQFLSFSGRHRFTACRWMAGQGKKRPTVLTCRQLTRETTSNARRPAIIIIAIYFCGSPADHPEGGSRHFRSPKSGPLTSHSDDMRIASTPHRRIETPPVRKRRRKSQHEIHNRVANALEGFFFLPLLRSAAPSSPLLSCKAAVCLPPGRDFGGQRRVVHCRYPSSYGTGPPAQEAPTRAGVSGRQARRRWGSSLLARHLITFFSLALWQPACLECDSRYMWPLRKITHAQMHEHFAG